MEVIGMNACSSGNVFFKSSRILLFFFLLICLTNLGFAEIIPAERRITWQTSVGIPGGIPNRATICSTAACNALSSGTYGDGITDATTAINNAIASCPVNQVVYLPAGTYKTTGIIRINKGIVLRGAGPLLTKISGSAAMSEIIYMSTGTSNYATGINITNGLVKDSSILTLADASTLAVGDFLVIDQLNDNINVTNIGGEGACTWCGPSARGAGTRAIEQISVITAKSGNNITINPPLQYTYNSTLDPEVAKFTTMLQYAGIENLYIENGAGSSIPINIYIVGVAYSWLKNVESSRPNNEHVEGRQMYRSEVRDSYFHEMIQYNQSSYGLFFGHGSTGLLVENNRFDKLHSAIMIGWGTSGSVFAYNFSNSVESGLTSLPPDISAHGAHTKMNLFEGNVVKKIHMDFTWGSQSHNTFFRNMVYGYQAAPYKVWSNGKYPIEVSKMNYYHNYVGNILGDPASTWQNYIVNGVSGKWSTFNIYYIGFVGNNDSLTGWDSNVAPSLLRHGNYDYLNGNTQWDGTIADRDIPSSLYLSAKPSWWCNESPWPPIGPDRSPMASDIPAKRRYNGAVCTTPSLTTPSLKYPSYPVITIP
jgi:hypothetical protein